MSGLIFFDELGKRMEPADVEKQEKSFVLLGMVQKNSSLKKNIIRIDDDDIKLASKMWVNQIKADGSFHFDTSGKIFGLGFGPKYSIDEATNLSIGQFAGRKRVTSDKDARQQIILKKKIFEFTRTSITSVFSTFNSLQQNISPQVSKLQIHFDLFETEKRDETYLQKNGILNAHLCFNAQTRVKHTESDSSYTIISVPDQQKQATLTGFCNKAEFEFNVTEHEAIVIPLQVGVTLVYSGFMLTHCQQIRQLNEDVRPFINVVSYNSQKMFNHLMESFRREIKINTKRK